VERPATLLRRGDAGVPRTGSIVVRRAWSLPDSAQRSVGRPRSEKKFPWLSTSRRRTSDAAAELHHSGATHLESACGSRRQDWQTDAVREEGAGGGSGSFFMNFSEPEGDPMCPEVGTIMRRFATISKQI